MTAGTAVASKPHVQRLQELPADAAGSDHCQTATSYSL
jgi:hypothetical protein